MIRRSRPGSVTFVAVLVWIYVLALAAVGTLWLMAAGGPSWAADLAVSSDDARLYGWVTLGFAMVAALTAIGLTRGSRFARFIIVALMVLRIGVEVVGIISIDGYPLWPSLLSIVWAALIVSMLSNRRASRWFYES